jgi:CspA family cold shock protein
MKGTVKWYNARKGYGFITPDDNSEDIFVHATALKNSGLKKLYTGSEVTYETDQDEKGRRAKSIKVTKEIKPKLDEKKDTKKKDTKKIDTKKKDTKKKDTKKKKQEKPKKKTKGKTTKGSKKK